LSGNATNQEVSPEMLEEWTFSEAR
jgi:hypothetical protein